MTDTSSSERTASDPEVPPASDPVAKALAVLDGVAPAELQARGYDLLRRDYYSPTNDICFLQQNRDLWQERPLPAGIDWNLDEQLRLLGELAVYAPELEDVSVEHPPGPAQFHWNNDFWRGTDAFVHYGLLRKLRPRRVVEIGCGWSSLLLARALARNEAEDGERSTVHQIEPYPRRELMQALPPWWSREESILQRSSPRAIEQLRKGDVLFYDGSHVTRAGSDVNWFFFELLPRLAEGVLVHVHDIFWPGDYPEQWIVERGQTWNEQYVLQAFLMYNKRFELLLANAAVVSERRAEVEALLQNPDEPIVSGGSVWFRRRTSNRT
jgi:hypothetical protein